MTRDRPLVSDTVLERSSVVANCEMNRERGLNGSNGYSRELGFDVLSELQRRLQGADGPVRWLDLCCGSGRALTDAAGQLARAGSADRLEIIGVDLVDYFASSTSPAQVRLITASIATWAPPAGMVFDLITCVHGLHYVGDKLAVLTRATSWLTVDGVFAASFDTTSVRRADGEPLGRALTAALRNNGFHYDSRNRRVTRSSRNADPALPFTYLGADDAAGPNYTGQPAVHSYYDLQPANGSPVGYRQ